MHQRTRTIFITTLSILIGFGLMLGQLQRDSLWLDEGWTASLVHDSVRPADSLRGLASQTVDSVLETLERVRSQDVHPQLYYLLLDGWVLLMGESEFSLRVPSALMGVLALAATFALGKRLLGREAGLMALVILGTSAFFLYYTREARMYTLALTLVLLATVAYWQWWKNPTWRNNFIYGVLIALALYTHYLTALVFVAHLLHLSAMIVTRQQRINWRLLPVFLLVGILYSAWVPFAFDQLSANLSGGAAAYIPTDSNTVSALWLVLTHGNGWLYVLPLIFTTALLDLRRDSKLAQVASWVVLWLIFPALILLALNAGGMRVFQLRYIFFSLPAVALLIALGLSRLYIPLALVSRDAPLWRSVALIWVILLAYAQLTGDPNLWPEKPRWREAVTQAADMRSADEPALVHIAPHSPLAYYDRQANLAESISIDVGWRPFAPDEISVLADTLANAESVWVIAPAADPSTWDAVRNLSHDRGVGYRDSVQGTIFYRFDRDSADEFVWAFTNADDEQLVQLSPVEAIPEQLARSTEFCHTPIFDITDNDVAYHVGLYLTRGYNEIIAQVDAPLVADATYCFQVPEDAPLEALHIRLAIYDPATGTRLSVVEGDGLLWSDFIVLGAVEVVE